MRSEYVFAASKKIGNRFLLCRMTSISARRLHKGATNASETINMSLKLIGAADDRASLGIATAETLAAESAPLLADAVVAGT
jgi:hypothetical protein